MEKNNTVKHNIDDSNIDPRAIEIVKKLQDKGYTTYLVGGCVRDLLIGQTPKDFDIATTARPQQVKRAINNAFIIGKRFRLVLVKRGDDQFEVATFRRNISTDELQNLAEEKGDLPFGDNYFGTPEEDALRRDFKINALFYDPIKKELIDFPHALNDFDNQLITMLGDPEFRLIEDPIRILRAIRFKYKTGFSLESSLRDCMQKYAYSLKDSVLPRVREEFLKILRLPDPSLAFLEANDLGVLEAITPKFYNLLHSDKEAKSHFIHFLRHFHDFHINKNNPLELWSLFALGLYRNFINENLDNKINLDSLVENEILSTILRNEFGVFKAEENQIQRSLYLLNIFNNKKEFLRKGIKKKKAIMNNENFYISHMMAIKDCSLSAEDALFWTKASEEHKKSNNDD
jgi:poly(A) polymerase